MLWYCLSCQIASGEHTCTYVALNHPHNAHDQISWGPSHNELRTCVPINCVLQILWNIITYPCPWYLLLADKSSIALLAITKLPFTCEISFFTMVTVISILRKAMETPPCIVCLLRVNHVQLESGASGVTSESGGISSHISDRSCDMTTQKPVIQKAVIRN